MNDIEEIDRLIGLLRSLKSSIKQYERAKEKAGHLTMKDNTPSQFAAAHTKMATLARAVTTEKVQFCRAFEAANINIGTDKITTNATGWQKQVI